MSADALDVTDLMECPSCGSQGAMRRRVPECPECGANCLSAGGER